MSDTIKNMQRIKRAFTLVEVVIVMGILAILFSLSIPQLFRLQDRNNLQTSITKLTSLLRQQQSTAMNSGLAGGIFFEPTRYIVFTGLAYDSLSPDNTVVELDYPIEFSQILFPTSQVVFASGSGEIVDFDPVNHSVALRDTVNSQEKNIIFNSLGVPLSIQ